MDETSITESGAWEIISEFVNDLLRLDKNGILAVYAIGSLGGGYYRPGISDIDTVIIVKNDAAITQENAEEIAAGYCRRYSIPKGFGAVVIPERELFPPYLKSEREEFEFTLEIVRLKLQGKAVFGRYDLSQVPMPAKDDFIRDAAIMENWFDREYDQDMFDLLSAEACVNSILIYMRRYLMIEKGLFILNKFQTVEAYQKVAPPVAGGVIFTLIDNLLRGGEAAESDLAALRCFGKTIRAHMNERFLNRQVGRGVGERA